MNNLLIIDCSPKEGGNTSYLINIFKQNVVAKVTHIKLFPQGKSQGIYPCKDCGACIKQDRCVIDDCFKDVIFDNYDIVLFASPIYMSNLPGPAFNLISRFNYMYNNKIHLNITHKMKDKRAILFLVGGGNSSKQLQGITNEDLPIKQSKYIFKKLNANLSDEDILLCLDTDYIKISNNKEAMDKVVEIAKSCN